MKKLLLSSILALLTIAGFAGSAPLIAFPGAEGFGKYAVGGRGGKVVAVTNLDDFKSSEDTIQGSLRWALSQYVSTKTVDKAGTPTSVTVYTPLTIVFNVSGTIWLKEDLKVKRDSLTIAGQTAPGDGICIAGHSVLFNGATGGEMFYWGPRRRELIVRYIRFRPGIPKDEDGNPTSDFVTYATDVENYENVIIDHCSMSWANEECLAIYDNKNTTVQWSLISEGLYNAYHPKGTRAYCGVWGGQYASYHHNAIAHNKSRTVRFDGSRAHDTIAVIEYRNNVIYNWGSSDGPYGGEIEIDGGRSEINMINNYYKKGPALSESLTVDDTNKGHRLLYCYDSDTTASAPKGQHYVNGNYVNEYPEVTTNNWYFGVQYKYSAFRADTAKTYSQMRLDSPSSEVSSILPSSYDDAETAFTSVLADAGATLPLRDAQDKRIMSEIENGTATGSGAYGTSKGIIDDPETVGGWPVLNTGTVLTDTDGDGMPDDWETANSLNINDSTDGNSTSLSTEGYTNLEVYLNSITAPTDFIQAPFNLTATVSSSSQIDLEWVDNSDNETGFEIQRAIKGSDSYTTITTVAADSTSYSDTITVDTTYVYRVRAINASTESAYTDDADYLENPLVLSATIVNNNAVIKWADYSTSETGFYIYRAEAGSTNYTNIASVSANTTSYTDGSCIDLVEYTYKVSAYYSSFESLSENTSAAISTDFQNPIILQYTLNESNQPVLTWTDRSNIEDGFEIQRTLEAEDNFVAIDSVGTDITTYTDITAEATKTYKYQVRAYSGSILTGYTNTITVSVSTSNNETNIEGLSVYPNPVKDILTVKADVELSNIEIYSATGLLTKKVEPNTNSTNINLSNYPLGIYYIKINSNNSQQTVNIIKE